MTAHRPQYRGYAGRWNHNTSGTNFTVFYISGADAMRNRRDDAGPKEAGWYWIAGRTAGKHRFTSSKAAWADARATLANKVTIKVA